MRIFVSFTQFNTGAQKEAVGALLEALTSSISESEQPHYHALQNTLHSGSGQVEVFCMPVYHRKCDFSCPLSLFKYFYS